jgi:hypothetical protein
LGEDDVEKELVRKEELEKKLVGKRSVVGFEENLEEDKYLIK